MRVDDALQRGGFGVEQLALRKLIEDGAGGAMHVRRAAAPLWSSNHCSLPWSSGMSCGRALNALLARRPDHERHRGSA